MGMLLARKCGVQEPEVNRAIEKTHTFFASFIGKGELPYGVHNPFTNIFNNNGKCGVAAVVMSLYGDREGASFFRAWPRPPMTRWRSGTAVIFSIRHGRRWEPMWPGRK